MKKNYMNVYVIMNESYGEIHAIVTEDKLKETLRVGLSGYSYDKDEIEEMLDDGWYGDVFAVHSGSVEVPKEYLNEKE